jgi:hypothetical protein
MAGPFFFLSGKLDPDRRVIARLFAPAMFAIDPDSDQAVGQFG